jgi:hypothetical protein
MGARRSLEPLLYCSLLGLTGCFTYTPVAADAVSPGAVTRVRLSAAKSERLRQSVPSAGRVVEGKLVAGADDALFLDLPTMKGPAAQPGVVLHQRIRLPLEEVIELEVRRLDHWKTGGLVAAGAIAVGLVIARQFGGGTTSSNLPPGGGGPAEWQGPVGLPLYFRK